MPKSLTVHGYVAVAGPERNPNYFTGCGYSAYLNEARVYRTERGAKCAARIWQHADYNLHPIPQAWWSRLRTLPVSLRHGENA